MDREQKAAVIEKISTELKQSSAVFAVDYRGISVSQVAELRTELRAADASFNVVKNTLTERAADSAGVTEIKELLSGPTALTFVRGDAALAAKAIARFKRENEILEFKGGMMDGAVVSVDEIMAISKLPARDVLYGQLVGMIAAPISGLVRSMNGLISGLAIQLRQIADQGLVSGEAEPPAAAETPEPAVEEAPQDAPAAEEPATEEPPAEEPAAPVDEPGQEQPEPEIEPEPENEPEQTDESETSENQEES